MNSVRTRTAVAVLAAAALVTTGAAPAFAAPSDLVVTAGGFTSTTPTVGNFTGVTLNGTAQTTSATLGTFSVTDNTGSGAGWKVTVAATQLKEWDGSAHPAGAKAFPLGSITLSAPSVTASGTTSSPVPTAAGGVIDSGTPLKIASAGVDEGMGTYDFSTTTASVTVPSNAFAKTYRSDVTITLASTP